MQHLLERKKIIAWQLIFLVFGMSWLLGPNLNHLLSYKFSLISHYEAHGQPYAWLFRVCDLVAGLAIVWAARLYYKLYSKGIDAVLLIVVAAGMIVDAVFATTCHPYHQVCQEQTVGLTIHAVESVATALAVFFLAAHDAYKRHKLVSYGAAGLQVLFGISYATQFSSHHFSTLPQYVYQCTVVVWLAWYCRDIFLGKSRYQNDDSQAFVLVRYVAAAWAFANGILAIIVSLAHIHVVGSIQNLYFVGNNAWLAQHGVVIGVVMLYLSRHLQRGEMRARQIFLVLAAIEAGKYALIAPDIDLLLVYFVTFCLLFVSADQFRRGAIPMTWRIRLKDLAYMVAALLVAALSALLALDSDGRASVIARRTFMHISQSSFHTQAAHNLQKFSDLLGDTATAFIVSAAIALLWILFRPYKSHPQQEKDFLKVRQALETYSNSTEDYFKLWPQDKYYLWDEAGEGFVAYKIQGPVAFALADPITAPNNRQALADQFISWCRDRRLRACFLMVTEGSLKYYPSLNKLLIGSSALVATESFLLETSKDKWWRWKLNKAKKQDYSYAISHAPHDPLFLQALKAVSDAWLKEGGHKERGFALGYFDEKYLNQCTIHYLTGSGGKVVAFTNQLPTFKKTDSQTIDLLRYLPGTTEPIPFLLYKFIESINQQGYKNFDLGFVPFAGAKEPLATITRTLSAGRFSAKGLEQFKNKFDPEWHPHYVLYDGDLADLALITLNLERAMGAT
ncbi:MAG: hypothetical protein JWL89_298 [Candidatus Saccharibacteria bacterium]|nr:hypothetical protein [Candidatus Saccharibacteria bacterium]